MTDTKVKKPICLVILDAFVAILTIKILKARLVEPEITGCIV